jgi:uncharacterized protein YndB with AHSA1/START domain
MAPKDLIERLLSPAEVRAVIPASLDAVFAVLSDPETYPEWLAGAQRIRHVDADFPEPGAKFDHEVGPADAATVADDSRVVSADAPHYLQLEVHAGPVTGLVEFELERTAEGTLVTFRESMAGRLGWSMPFARGLIHARNRASLDRLKARFGPLIVPLK